MPYRLNVDVDERNSHMLNALVPESQQYTIKACDAIAGQTSHVDLSNVSEKRSETGGLHGVLKLAIGARVMLTTNIDVSDGLVNGARGTVVHVACDSDGKTTHILVNFDNTMIGLRTQQSSRFHDIYPDAVPLKKHEAVFFARGKRGSEVTRVQFPLTLAWASTIHKVQGLTLDEIVVDMKGGRFSPGQAYVAFSRVKKLEGLHIVNFNPKAIKASEDVKEEMARLAKKQLSPLPLFTPQNHSYTIALLNIRSILPKLPDIDCDSSLKSADILCFTETWLASHIDCPAVVPGHQIIRVDRQYLNSKGGVLISAPHSIVTTEIHQLTVNHILIEALGVTLLLPNGNLIHIVLVYRSPYVPIGEFMCFMTETLSQMNISDIPCFILGDFNEDLLVKPNSPLLTLMACYGFSQLVTKPTTNNGSLLDHIYTNKSSDFFQLFISDTYYSDHDIICCSFPTELYLKIHLLP